MTNMSPEAHPGRRSRPSQLQTNLPLQSQLVAIPASAASSSSAASNSEHVYPTTSAEPASMLGGLTIQPSPESLRGRALEVSIPPPFQLPDAVLSRRRSSNSLTQSTVTSPSSTAQEPVRAPNMMRRFSNRVNNRVSAFTGSMGSALGSGARRQSSAHTISRDGSVGPSVIRNRLRSNSNNSAILPPDNAFYSDSEDDAPNDNDNTTSFYGGDATSLRDFSPLTTTGSPSGTSSPGAEDRGPTIPQALEHGTWISKLSKKKKPKRIFLTLDPDAAKIYWDKKAPAKWIYLDDIKEVRTGGDLSQYRATFNAPDSYETRGFSLIVATPDKGRNRMIHLVAETEESLHDWTTAIERLIKHREDFIASLMSFDDDAVQAFWESEMTRKSGGTPKNDAERRIDLDGLKNICRNLHIHLPEATMLERFSEAMTMNEELRADASLDRRGFMAFVQLVKTRLDIQPIYRQFASDHRLGLTLEDFFRFLRESQGENVEEESSHWQSRFAELLRKAKSKSIARLLDDRPRLSEAAFASFFATDANPLPRETDVVQSVNLDRPMNEYYISSSHNTYLLGYQVRGESSVEGYISALSRGCRCVEIDCWDGPKNNEPVVMHGHSLTTQISFREVINTINKYAFVKSNYPLWISLEIRCSSATQENMVKIMLDTFADKLVLQPMDPKSDRLPSPSQLMGRILIKVKKPQGGGDELRRGGEIIGRRRGNSFTSPLQRPTSMDNGSLPGSPLLSPLGNPSRKTSTKINTITEGRVPEATPSSSTSEQDSDSDKDPTKKAPSKINPILGCMGVYAAGITFSGFDAPEAKVFNHIFSFKEKTFRNNDTPKERKRALFRHNMRYMMRVYPDATRFTSSNFNPLTYWKRGVQMAALNWQTFDLGMQINQAMFECGTDQSGYVLKSKGLREIQMIPNGPGEWATKRERKNVRLSIEVISAQQLMRPFNLEGRRTLDPYVEVELFLPDDKQHKGESAGGQKENALKLHTKIVRGNGFNPSFGDKLEFPNVQTKYPDLVFVRWTVKLADKNVSDKAQVLGRFTAKLEHLKKGYRTLPLLDHNGDRYLFSTLFCRIDYDVTSVFVPAPTDDADGSNSRFRVVRPSFLNRSNLSPKTSQENGMS